MQYYKTVIVSPNNIAKQRITYISKFLSDSNGCTNNPGWWAVSFFAQSIVICISCFALVVQRSLEKCSHDSLAEISTQPLYLTRTQRQGVPRYAGSRKEDTQNLNAHYNYNNNGVIINSLSSLSLLAFFFFSVLKIIKQNLFHKLNIKVHAHCKLYVL